MATMNNNSILSPFPFKGVPTPLGNVNPNLVNVDNSNDPANFGSIETSRQFSLDKVPISSIDAANSYIPGVTTGGGRKRNKYSKHSLKLKIKKIASKYKKMKKGGKALTLKSMKRQLGSVFKMIKSDKKTKKTKTRRVSKKTKSNKKSRGVHKHRGGGYHQYMGNVPNTPIYETGSVKLSASESALANPVPFKVLPNCQNCTDNYNYNTNKGFQLW